MCSVDVYVVTRIYVHALCNYTYAFPFFSESVNVNVYVAGQLPSDILMCQYNSLPSLIFNKAPREPRTSSSKLSICS